MNEPNEIIEAFDTLVSKSGYTVAQFLKLYGEKKSSLIDMDEDSFREYNRLFEILKSGTGTDQERGKVLEDLVYCLMFSGTNKLFNCLRNCRTSTNEIDLLVRWSDHARFASLHSVYSFLGDCFLCECKNYAGRKVNVTFVGKFCSLINSSQAHIGIMFAPCGIASRNKWSDASGLIKKYALSEKKYILIVDMNDLEAIADRRANFFTLLKDKYTALKNDISFSEYIKPHECELTLLH